MVSKHQVLDDALVKAKPRSKHWEWETKAGVEKITVAEKEMDEAKEEVQLAQIAVVVAGDVKARAVDNLARVQDVLAIEVEARRKAKAKELHSWRLNELHFSWRSGRLKDEVSSFRSQLGKAK